MRRLVGPILLCLATALPLLPALPARAEDMAQAISGATAQRLVTEAMAAAGQAASDVPVPIRPLPGCGHVPKVEPLQGNWATAQLTCDFPDHWTRALRTMAAVRHDPAARGAKAEVPQGDLVTAVTLVHSLDRGARIQAGDVMLSQVPALAATEIFRDPAEVVGRKMKQTLGVGQPLLLRHLEPAWLVETDIPATLVATGSGVEISIMVIPLGNGVIGDTVQVRNPGSGRVLYATVTGDKTLQVAANMN